MKDTGPRRFCSDLRGGSSDKGLGGFCEAVSSAVFGRISVGFRG